jgi:hypothetical protein
MAEKNKKSLDGTSSRDWLKHRVQFNYLGKDYDVPIADNMYIKDLTPDEIKKYLNETPAKFSYWKSILVDLERQITDLEEDFEIWFQTKYMEVHDKEPKTTEKYKTGRVMLNNSEAYRTKKAILNDLKDIAKKIGVIIGGYTTLTWTLREVARMTTAELSNLEPHGGRSGSLAKY